MDLTQRLACSIHQKNYKRALIILMRASPLAEA
jgi:hypothetical protein